MHRRVPTPNTPFIPPLDSAQSSPNPHNPPQLSRSPSSSGSQQNQQPTSTPWYSSAYPLPQGGAGPANPSAYPNSAYPAFVSPGGGGPMYAQMTPMGPMMIPMSMASPAGFVPPYMTPIGATPGVIPPGVMIPNFTGITPPQGPSMQLGGGVGGQWPAGVSSDYTGYPPPGGTTPFSGNVPLSAGAQGHGQQRYQPFSVPPMSAPPMFAGATPGWGGQGGVMPGGFGAYQTPAPQPNQPLGGGGGGGAWGLDAAMAAQLGGMNMGGAPPAGYPAFGGPHPGGHRRPQAENEGDRVDPFTVGDNYGPVLDPFLVKVVKARLRLNPILCPPTSTTGAYLDWNMLFTSSNIHLSTDPQHKSWSAGRGAPATFPRTTSLTIITALNTFPWYIEVRAAKPSIGVTCGEVAEVLASQLARLTARKDWNALGALGPHGKELQGAVSEAYRRNRGRGPGVPGGILGEGMKRLDYLREHVWWGGLDVVDVDSDDQECRDIMRKWLNQSGRGTVVGMPCVVVLRTESMATRSGEEVMEWDRSRQRRASHGAAGEERQRTASRAASRGLSRGPSRGPSRGAQAPSAGGGLAASGRSRAGSRAAGSRPGSSMGVRVEEPSDDEDPGSSDDYD